MTTGAARSHASRRPVARADFYTPVQWVLGGAAAYTTTALICDRPRSHPQWEAGETKMPSPQTISTSLPQAVEKEIIHDLHVAEGALKQVGRRLCCGGACKGHCGETTSGRGGRGDTAAAAAPGPPSPSDPALLDNPEHRAAALRAQATFLLDNPEHRAAALRAQATFATECTFTDTLIALAALHLTRQAGSGMNVPSCYHPDAIETTIALMKIKHVLRLWTRRRRVVARADIRSPRSERAAGGGDDGRGEAEGDPARTLPPLPPLEEAASLFSLVTCSLMVEFCEPGGKQIERDSPEMYPSPFELEDPEEVAP